MYVIVNFVYKNYAKVSYENCNVVNKVSLVLTYCEVFHFRLLIIAMIIG